MEVCTEEDPKPIQTQAAGHIIQFSKLFEPTHFGSSRIESVEQILYDFVTYINITVRTTHRKEIKNSSE